MLRVKKEGIILRPGARPFENEGVFNPGCVQVGNTVHMFYRAFSRQQRSTVGYCRLQGPLHVVGRSPAPVLSSEHPYEKNLEDPRVVFLDGTYYLTYVAYDGLNVRLAYATSTDLVRWQKRGILLPDITYDRAEDLFHACRSTLKERYFLFESYFKDVVGKDVLLWNKDHFFFPRKIGGKFALVHRILPDIQVMYFRRFADLTPAFLERYLKNLSRYVILQSKYWYESRNIGGGAPPLETNKGWLLLYHAVDDMDRGVIYRGGAALLDRKDPTKVIGHLPYPLLTPDRPYEKKGNMPNVIFPSGTAVFGRRLYIYYGAADKCIAAASVDLDELLAEMVRQKRAERQDRFFIR
ncbi:MAG TPA: pesticidal protein Cry7Aa [Candidatus Nanoarchaeia archaeon]|nr:pesticidal protein Cry7Aa [Candidatus Nanoarchaeia archaeon]